MFDRINAEVERLWGPKVLGLPPNSAAPWLGGCRQGPLPWPLPPPLPWGRSCGFTMGHGARDEGIHLNVTGTYRCHPRVKHPTSCQQRALVSSKNQGSLTVMTELMNHDSDDDGTRQIAPGPKILSFEAFI